MNVTSQTHNDKKKDNLVFNGQKFVKMEWAQYYTLVITHYTH